MKRIVATSILVAALGSPAISRDHVSNCITQEQADFTAARFVLMCSASAYPKNVRMFTAPNLLSEYSGGIGNAPADYVDMIASHISEGDGHQFLCGQASNVNGYPIVRNLTDDSGTEVLTDWCILSADAHHCGLQGPRITDGGQQHPEIDICEE